MDQQSKSTKADILDVVSTGSSSGKFSSISFHDDHDQRIGVKRENLGKDITEAELKIRGELENDIERNLEEEIKDGIYHLALRLHRLYQHQKERNAFEVCGDELKKKNKLLSEVKISIRMEGGTKIEIKEAKKEEDADKGRRCWTPSSSGKNYQAMLQLHQVSKHKKFDWANSLRSGNKQHGAINKKNSKSYKAELGWKC